MQLNPPINTKKYMRYAMSNFSQSIFSKLIISMQFSLIFLAVQYTVK